MVTGNLLRAARVLAGLETPELAEKAGLPADALDALEAAGSSAISGQEAALRRLLSCLRRAGVEVRPDDGPSLRVLPSVVDEGLRPEALNANNDG